MQLNITQLNFKRIAIILLGSLGDVVRGLSVADGLKAHNPAMYITWIVEPKCAEIVALSPSVDEIIVFERSSPFRGLLSLQSKLTKFDCVLDMQRHFKSGFFSWMTRAPYRIGFHKSNSKELNWIFNTYYIPPQPVSLNKFHHYQEFLKILGLPPRKTSILNVKAQKVPRQVSIILGSSWDSKNWVGEGYTQLLKTLIEKQYSIILLGGKDQEALGSSLTKLDQGKIESKVGKTNLRELVDFIVASQFCIGPDSGPGHIAGVLSVPYISLFGPTDPSRVAPINNEERVVRADIGCAPCYRRTCPGLDKLCMRLIAVNDILQQVSNIENHQKGIRL